MGVTFTANLGLAKPDESEIAENWVNFTQLQDDNNLLIAAATNLPITTYTPVLKATTADPNVGSTGSLVGEYQDIQGVIFGSARVIFGDPGVTAGTGEYVVSLPLVADNTYHVVGSAFSTAGGGFDCIGEGFIYDNTVVDNSGPVVCDVVTVSGVSYMRMLTEKYTSPAKTSIFMRNAMPFTVADSDRFILNFCYKKL